MLRLSMAKLSGFSYLHAALRRCRETLAVLHLIIVGFEADDDHTVECEETLRIVRYMPRLSQLMLYYISHFNDFGSLHICVEELRGFLEILNLALYSRADVEAVLDKTLKHRLFLAERGRADDEEDDENNGWLNP